MKMPRRSILAGGMLAMGSGSPAEQSEASTGDTLRRDLADVGAGDALVAHQAPEPGALPRTARARVLDLPRSLRDFAPANGIDDDSAGIAAAFAASKDIYVPPGTYRLSETMKLPYACRFLGAGAETIFRATGVIGPAVQISAPDYTAGNGPYAVGDFMIAGRASSGLHVDRALRMDLRNIYLDGFEGTDGFILERTFHGKLESLGTNGARLTGSSFICGESFNANTCANWSTSNRAARGLVLDESYNGGSAPSHGAAFTGLCIQSCDLGVDIVSYRGATFVAPYMEDVVQPFRMGNADAGKIAAGIVIAGGSIQGPFHTHPNYEDRRAVFDLDYVQGVEIAGVDLIAGLRCGDACPLTIVGDGSGAFAQARVHRVRGAWRVHSVEVLCEGAGYTTAMIRAGGAGAGAAFTPTLVGGKIAGIAVTAAGSGYAPVNLPVLIAYRRAYRVRLGPCLFNSGLGEESPMYPWLVRKPGAVNRSGIHISDDLSWRGPTPCFGSAELRKTGGLSGGVGGHQHVLLDSTDTGAERRTLYTPPEYG